ncbi:cytochrome C peroxidase [Tribonema minus]|uniref:Cytochrome c peroxidase, mitochondrial n=1 Tax=Tribonema minus TaxID=303371 RepID=A0A836CLD9_9STRA|nr:cytochrome C peroxidase [Tribonema minus]
MATKMMAASSEPTDRRALFKIISTTVASVAACTQLQTLQPANAAETATKLTADEVNSVREAVSKIVNSDLNKGPTLVRLAWHCSGTYDKVTKTGGSGGGTIRFKSELAHGANAGLAKAVEWLEPIKTAHPNVSYGDLYTLAGVQAIYAMAGPQIPWRAGRVDADESTVTPGDRLPDADKGDPMRTAAGLRATFNRMGFNDQEIVALSGAHALGRCHRNNSGYEGPWTPTPTNFNNLYFKLLKNVNWTPKNWDGKPQFENEDGRLMMLPSDIVLLQDKEFKKWVDVYASSERKFFEDFSKAFSKLEELGTDSSLYTV